MAAPLPGVVKSVAVAVGATVQAGDVLLELDDREARGIVETQQALVSAQEAKVRSAEIQLAERSEQVRRIEQLRREQASSEGEVQRARYAQQTAEAALVQVRAEREASRAQRARAEGLLQMLTVRAPRAGLVLQVHVRPGEAATPTAAERGLLLLGSERPLQLRAFLAEADAARLQRGAKATARLGAGAEADLPLQFERLLPNFSAAGPEGPPPVAQAILRCPSELPPTLRAGQVVEIVLQD